MSSHRRPLYSLVLYSAGINRWLYLSGLIAILCLTMIITDELKAEEAKLINRDTLLVMLESYMQDGCDIPNSPYACITTNIDICRKSLDTATKTCVEKLRGELPEEVDLNQKEKLSKLIGKCSVEEFITVAGAENLDLKKCKRKKQLEP